MKWLMARKRQAILAAVVLIACGAGYYGYRVTAAEKTETVTTEETVQQGDLTLSWKSDGSAERDVVYLDFAVGGVLKEVDIKQGDTIKAGQTLARIDPEEYQKALETAEINYRKALAAYTSAVNSGKLSDLEQRDQLNAAKVTLDKAAADYLPKSQLTEAYSAQEIELSRIAYENAKSSYESQLAKFDLMKADNSNLLTQKANLDAAKIALEQARENLADTVLIADADGRVVEINGKAGDYVRSSTDASTSTDGHLFTLAADEAVKVAVDVQEIDYSKLSVGQTANVSFEAAEGQSYSAKVISVEAIPTIDNNGVVTYSAVLQLDKEAPEIQTGMSGTVEFIQKQVKDVLIIPNKAVTIKNRKQTVKVKGQDGAVGERTITTGFTDGTQCEVASGLEAGETVLLETVKTGAAK